MLRLWLIALVLGIAMPAHADAVALLPLDGEKRLEIYGQPIANELARAMTASGIDVVVVGAKMAVPARAQLIVDGSIKANKDTVTLTIRIRDPRDGTTLETLPPSTSKLTNIDQAAAEVSARVVPAVKTQLEALAKATPAVVGEKPPVDAKPVPTSARLPALAVYVARPAGTAAENQILEDAFGGELDPWARRHGHQIQPVAAAAAWRADEGVTFTVNGFSITRGTIPMGKARVGVRIIAHGKVVFDRTVVTDTIVGDRGLTPQQFAARAAREVLLIAHPHMRRAIASWR
jgi:hypothetical protein